jgi:iron complex outermembrane recepter protein
MCTTQIRTIDDVVMRADGRDQRWCWSHIASAMVIAACCGAAAWAQPPETDAAHTATSPDADTDIDIDFGADATSAPAPEETPELAEEGNIYASMNLEDLMLIEVTSVTGTSNSWFTTPAALDVITSEDIRRSGHLSIPEALRLAPGLHVARTGSSMWGISSRGFSSQFANKLQVLMDGRRLYDPLFSGVYWDVQDYVLADIDRIEVIRGPGATLWGANAVNGVINITTKTAAETQGLYLNGGAGTFDQGFGEVRYGGQINEDAHFRVYGKYRNLDGFADLSGGDREDDWDMWQSGFRADFGDADDTMLTIQGDAYVAPRLGEQTFLPVPTGHLARVLITDQGRASGGNLLARLQRTISDRQRWTLQAYYDRADRTGPRDLEYTRDSFDIDFRHDVKLGERHELLWGVNFRHDSDHIVNGLAPEVVILPDERTFDTFSAFVQDTITLAPDRLFAMIGSKFEDNDFTGFEWQPSARMWWTPDDQQTLWAAVSRPVRTPSRVEEDISLVLDYADPGLLTGGPPAGFLIPLTLNGNPDVDSERLMAYEAGYRRRLTDTLTVDVAVFYNDYDDLIGGSTALLFDNVDEALVKGIELAATWQVADNWRLRGSYTMLDMDSSMTEPGSGGTADTPRHQFQVHSELDITQNIEFNAALYYVDDLPAGGAGDYARLDLGVTWRPQHNVALSVWGQNLLDPQHPESNSNWLVPAGQVERTVYMQASIEF